ncbi:DENN domain-containing protein 1B isoform X5 [Desmodus rotundus]|uniref:DENN domain-containing protein 1B isoform X5 n=1 Tax=Desmodus rotundus TaxID=9430 RepID=UPI0023813012|nr:DENN domain-containing protein 1B isoform X5 [Desmodus rotundus]
MDSRTRENPERTFDLVLNVKCHASENEDPVVLWKFPEDFGDQEVLQSVPKFCFPFDVERVSQNQVGQHFTFVLTDIESKQRFGFCRLTSGGRTCLCILSYLPWFEVYYKLLNTLADYLAKEQESDLNVTLRALYDHPVPKANSPVNLSVLTACLHGSAALLFPMFWQHIFIPVLPPHLLDYCCAPMPYLIGIHSSLIERVKNKSLEDVVMLNVDTNTLESPFNDLINLPSDVVSALKNKLKKQSTATGDGVARAFLRAQAALFGSYRDALRYKPGEPVTFCEESFVQHRSSPMKQFLEAAVNLQLFKQFIDGRLAKLNSGRGFSDVFEEEITSGGFCGGSPRSYHQWVHTVKKGGALFNSAMTKATPAVRTAYKFAKSQAKQGIREVKSKLKHKDTEDGCGTCSGCVQYTPVYTLHSEKGADPEKRRLTQARLKRPRKSLDGPVYDDDNADRASKLSSEDGEEAPADFYESDDSVETGAQTVCSGEMDLLGEILDTLSTHSSDQGKLAAAKSLDFFRSLDNIDYKATNKSNAPSENNLALLDGGSGDQTEWHLGQDDCALHGKHLPPSPRKRTSSGVGLTESLFILTEESRDQPLRAPPDGGPAAAEPDSQRAPPAASPTTGEGKPEDRETLRQTSEDPVPGLGRCPSSSVPWEKEGRAPGEPAGGSALLGEVASLCRVSAPLRQDLSVSEENTSGNRAEAEDPESVSRVPASREPL